MKKKDSYPDKNGYFGDYGGRFAPETLMPVLLEMEQAYIDAKDDPAFMNELNTLLSEYVGRPTPLTFAKNLTEKCGGARFI